MSVDEGSTVGAPYHGGMTTWEYSTIPLLTHATKAILDQWGQDGWELVQVVPGPTCVSPFACLSAPCAPAGRRRAA